MDIKKKVFLIFVYFFNKKKIFNGYIINHIFLIYYVYSNILAIY